MILSFKKQFKDKILNGEKIHTIREDKPNRWKEGRKIHFSTGVRTKNYECFKEGECISTQTFNIRWYKQYVEIYIDGELFEVVFNSENKITYYSDEVKELAIKDGFESIESFLEWFSEDFYGKIIHWTNKKY